MTDLATFPVTHKWLAQHPERLQLYSLPTPNGVKVSIMPEVDAAQRYETIQWLMFQMGGIGPMLGQPAWLMGDAIADIATFPWGQLVGFYEAGELVGMQDIPSVTRALPAFVGRSAVVRGLEIPAWT